MNVYAIRALQGRRQNSLDRDGVAAYFHPLRNACSGRDVSGSGTPARTTALSTLSAHAPNRPDYVCLGGGFSLRGALGRLIVRIEKNAVGNAWQQGIPLLEHWPSRLELDPEEHVVNHC